jgi:hypothetical protein
LHARFGIDVPWRHDLKMPVPTDVAFLKLAPLELEKIILA